MRARGWHPMASVEIKGLSELARVLDQAPNKLKWGVLRSATEGMAEVIQKSAMSRAPVRTGKLRRSIARRRQRPVRDVEWFKVAVRRSAFYWRFQEFGSSRNAAHPYLRPAVAQDGAKAIAVFRDKFREGVIKVMVR